MLGRGGERLGQIYTWDNTEAWCAGSRADLSDLGVIWGTANPRAALQLLQTLLLFQVGGFCEQTQKKKQRIDFKKTLSLGIRHLTQECVLRSLEE